VAVMNTRIRRPPHPLPSHSGRLLCVNRHMLDGDSPEHTMEESKMYLIVREW
jgi:hypothetical protein